MFHDAECQIWWHKMTVFICKASHSMSGLWKHDMMLGPKEHEDKSLVPCVLAIIIFKCFILYSQHLLDIFTWKYNIYHNQIRTTRELLIFTLPNPRCFSNSIHNFKKVTSFSESLGKKQWPIFFHALHPIYDQTTGIDLQNTSRILILLSTSITTSEVQAVIISHLEYCRHLLTDLPESFFKNLNQKMSVFCSKSPNASHRIHTQSLYPGLQSLIESTAAPQFYLPWPLWRRLLISYHCLLCLLHSSHFAVLKNTRHSCTSGPYHLLSSTWNALPLPPCGPVPPFFHYLLKDNFLSGLRQVHSI